MRTIRSTTSSAPSTALDNAQANGPTESLPTLYLPAGETGTTHTLSSAQGVRQGDPLSPLMFSLGIRQLLADLASALGSQRLILAYLEDIYILSDASEPAATATMGRRHLTVKHAQRGGRTMSYRSPTVTRRHHDKGQRGQRFAGPGGGTYLWDGPA
jgi:hypothetical protein